MEAATTINTRPDELFKFYKLLTKDKPTYKPFLFPLQREGKDPWERVSWKNNRKTLNECLMLMKKGYNIGIAAKKDDPLVIIDVDDMAQVPEIKPTLQCISRKRIGRHNYYFAADETAKKNIAADTAGEIRTCWQYVVAPGSYVPCNEEIISKMPEDEKSNAGHYSIYKENAVNLITYEEFPEVYKEADMKRRAIDACAAVRKIVPKQQAKPGASKLWELNIYDVAGVCETGGKRIPMPSEIHGSDTGKNCSVSRGLLHCWRHEVAHNAFSYLCVLAGVATCEESGIPHGGRFYGVDSTDGETVFAVWKYAKERGLIPQNDKIPHSALLWYAKSKCVTSKKENEKLNDLEYEIVKELLKKEGL